jgi:peptidoglycan/xylan/chitin deacetylase (PgdA/CDA1 family)
VENLISNAPYRSDGAPKVVLKFDDLRQVDGAVAPAWQRVHALAKEHSIPFSVGIICNSLVPTAPSYFKMIQDWHASGVVEFWNHGYDHEMWDEGGVRVREFIGSGCAHQLKHFQLSQDLGRQKLGIEFTTFGAPFNCIDADTVEVMKQFPEISVWMNGPEQALTKPKVINFSDQVYLEVELGKLNFDHFRESYLNHKQASLLVLQAHPMRWAEQDFEYFVRTVEFLLEQGASFVLPRDCVEPDEDTFNN